MDEELYISLLQKRLSSPLTPEEQLSLDAWLAQSPDNQLVANQVERVWNISGSFSQAVDLDADADFERLEQRILAADATAPTVKLVPMKPRRNWLAVAAAVIVLLAAPLVLRKFMGGNNAPMETIVTNDSPTPQPVALADGSKVWLNSHSTLRYFTSADGDERRVELTGEAFFEVAKNPEKPFVVQTNLGEVTVLGTSFNVRSLANSPNLEVNVSTGKVRLQPKDAKEHLLLLANETGIFDQAKQSLVKTGGMANNAAAWHTGKLVFENASLEEALRQLSALHNVRIVAESETVKRCTLTVTFDRTPLGAALETLGALFGATVEKVSDREYRLLGGRCE